MVILDIEDNWYLFLVFAGGFSIITGIVLFFEKRKDKDDILRIKPLIVLRNIIINQIGFYMIYLLVVFTLDISAGEIFWWTQVFTAVEFSFVTKRGLLTGLSLIVTMGSTCIATSATVQTYRNMLDYCFTVFVLHFIVVSIVENDFPVYGSWWAASAVGLILFMIISERMSYHLETMSYQSSLHEAKYKFKKSKKEETELPEMSEEEEHFTSSGSYSSKLEGKPKDSSEEGENSVTNKGEEIVMKENKRISKETEESSQTESGDSKERKNSLRKRGTIEEKALKGDNNTREEDEFSDEEVEAKKRSRSSPKLEKKMPSTVKKHQLKEKETGKKDRLKNAKQRDTVMEVDQNSIELKESKKIKADSVKLDEPKDSRSESESEKIKK